MSSVVGLASEDVMSEENDLESSFIRHREYDVAQEVMTVVEAVNKFVMKKVRTLAPEVEGDQRDPQYHRMERCGS